MNKTMKTKEELRKALSAVIAKEHKELVDKHYSDFKKLEGAFYKYRNSYGGNSRSWWLYQRIDKIERSDIYLAGDNVICRFKGTSFQICCYGEININQNYKGYCHTLGTKISESEFNEAWNKIVDILNSL